MPRKSKTKPPIQEAETASNTAVLEPPVAVAEPQATTSSQAESSANPEPITPESPPSFVERLGERSNRPFVPDPFQLAVDSAAGVRLFENKQRRVMAIKFDERPIQPVLELMKSAGFGWNPGDQVWTRPLREETAMSTRIDAERVYQEASQMIRQEKGIIDEKDIPF